MCTDSALHWQVIKLMSVSTDDEDVQYRLIAKIQNSSMYLTSPFMSLYTKCAVALIFRPIPHVLSKNTHSTIIPCQQPIWWTPPLLPSLDFFEPFPASLEPRCMSIHQYRVYLTNIQASILTPANDQAPGDLQATTRNYHVLETCPSTCIV